MEKEFTALEIGIPKLKKLYENNAKKMSKNDILGFDLIFVYLDKALTELKQIKETKPSDALSAYEYINVHLDVASIRGSINDFEENLKTICLFLKNAREYEHRTLVKAHRLEDENAELKEVLRVIFEKNVDINLLKNCISCYSDSCYAYNDYIKKRYKTWHTTQPLSDFQLTQEEFDTLKRYVKCLN